MPRTVAILITLLGLTSVILTAAVGVWLLVQTVDPCLGKSSKGIAFTILGFALIMMICCGLCSKLCELTEKQAGELIIAGVGIAVSFAVVMITFSTIALTESTTQFASFQKEINSTERWMDIKPCLYSYKKLCAHFQHKYANDAAQKFFSRHLTRMESGCCKPPIECNFNFSSPTVWIKPENGTYSNSDCSIWNNDPKKLCYNCQACKLSFARDLKKPWTIAGAVVLVPLLMLISTVIIAVVLQCE